MKTIVVTFDEAAQFTVETKGFKGKACQQATAEIRSALGIEKSEVKTAEFYQQEQVQKQTQGGK